VHDAVIEYLIIRQAIRELRLRFKARLTEYRFGACISLFTLIDQAIEGPSSFKENEPSIKLNPAPRFIPVEAPCM
jgi:hypothetical protein